MRISDWSSDVCSSDLRFGDVTFTPTDFFHALEISKQKHSAYKDAQQKGAREALGEISTASLDRAAAIIADLACKSTHCHGYRESRLAREWFGFHAGRHQIGRASCRERVCQYV